MTRPRTLTVAMLLLAFAAPATVVVNESLEEMTHKVPLIVRGHVNRNVSGWDAEHRRIWTWTELTVSDTIKGKAPGVLLFKQPGGETGGLGQAVAGTAKFQEGEDCVVLLFPAPDEPGVWRVYSLAAGKIALATEHGQVIAKRDLTGLGLASPATGKVTPVGSAEQLGSADELIAKLRVWANGGAK